MLSCSTRDIAGGKRRKTRYNRINWGSASIRSLKQTKKEARNNFTIAVTSAEKFCRTEAASLNERLSRGIVKTSFSRDVSCGMCGYLWLGVAVVVADCVLISSSILRPCISSLEATLDNISSAALAWLTASRCRPVAKTSMSCLSNASLEVGRI